MYTSMVHFRVTTEIRAPPQFVADWWWDYSPTDQSITPGMAGREVERVDDRTVRLTTHTQFDGHIRTTIGTVTRTGPANWHITGHVSSGGHVVSTLQTSYFVAPTSDGTRLEADFEFVGRTFPWKLALAFARFSLRRDRARTFRQYARLIEGEFAADPSARPPGPPRTERLVDPPPAS
ncbi:MAG: SRPBCC family protein [Thermoplasmata archaeon]